MADIALREASDAEIARIYRANADHIVATLNGEPMVYIRLQPVEGRRWGMLNIVSPIAPAFVAPLFFALRRRLKQEREPIYTTAASYGSPRLLELIGLKPTAEMAAGMKVWVWIPECS